MGQNPQFVVLFRYSMAPTTKASSAKPLLGQPDSVLGQDFLVAVQGDQPYEDMLPFAKSNQLPTKEQVLKLYYYLREQVGKNNKHISQLDLSKKVAGFVTIYWQRAGFKTVTFFRIVNHIQKLIESYQKIVKNLSKTTPKEVEKRESYEEEIKKLFDIAAPDLEEALSKDRILGKDDACTVYREKEGYTRKTEDLHFLNDQRGDRKMVMGQRDLTYEQRLENSILKKRKKLEMEEEVRQGHSKSLIEKVQIDDPEEETIDDEVDDTDFAVMDRNRNKIDKVLVELPRDIMNSPEVCAMLDRTGTTSRKAVGLVASILKSGNVDGKAVDLSSFSLSSRNLERKRIQNRAELEKLAVQEFTKYKPKYAALHWDGAMFKDITGTLQEHESILVSGAPHYVEGKILSVTKLTNEDGNPTSTGEAQADAVLKNIEDWGVGEDIVAFVFDTTASNSGRVRGATVRLQKALGRPILFLGCRHHVSELLVKACWYSIFEADLSPDCKFFASIKEEWASFDTSSEAEFLTIDLPALETKEPLEFYMELLIRKDKRNQMTVRDDYRELAECAVLVLGKIPPSGKIVWRKPGACHKARFCAFGIYSLKALAFARQLDLDDETVEALKRFCRFTSTIYIPHFLSSSIGSDSPVNDMSLYKKLFDYKRVDTQLAEEALVVLRRHGWYLTPEVVVFSLFSSKLSMDMKSRLASKLLTFQASIPESYKLEKPKFPVVDKKTELVDLLTPQSFKFFTILGLGYEWLAKNPEQWEEEEDFNVAREFVKTVKVTNDVAERGVKMAADYATILTKDDKIRAMILQGVEMCRKKFPNFHKKTLNE